MIAEKNCLTVAQLTKYVKRKFDADPYLNRNVYVVGQLTDFRLRKTHQYFSLKDDQADGKFQLSVVMFQSAFAKVKFTPENGMRVIIRGRLSVYEARGNYQLYAEAMEVTGVGTLQVQFEQLYKKLRQEGLFDRPKKTVRPFPKRIAVVTSNDAAVKHDIITTVRRRNRLVQLVFYPTRVQGEQAAGEIAAQIKRVSDAKDYDAVIVARGGGSLEDLWPFNEEVVARAINQANLPVISSIGHETDTTITDLVADVRTATPTAAAEAVTKWPLADVIAEVEREQTLLYTAEKRQLANLKQRLLALTESYFLKQPERLYERQVQQVDELTGRLQSGARLLLASRSRRVQELQTSLEHHSPRVQLAKQQMQLARLQQGLRAGMRGHLEEERGRLIRLEEGRRASTNLLLQATQNYQRGQAQRLDTLIKQLDALSPLKVLGRGFALVTKDEQVVAGVDQLAVGDEATVKFEQGQAQVTVTKIEKGNN